MNTAVANDQPAPHRSSIAKLGSQDYARAVFLAAALLPPLLAFVALWIMHIADLDAGRIAVSARDYTDMWAAGHLIAHDQGGTLFNLAAFNAALQSMFGANFPQQVWPYPPPILLLAVPLSRLPLLPGFLLYTAATVGLLWIALRSGGLTPAACGTLLLSPVVADNALTGQNGSLTSALLLGGLLLVHRRPSLAGAILGTLIIKPQLALLVPVCLVASGIWRALLAMAASASLLIALSCIAFGLHPWIGFVVHTRPMVAAILEAPWQALPAQRIFASSFMAARSVGAGMQLAWCLQGAVALVCAVAVWRAWRIPAVDPILRAAFTGLLALAAAPWVHTYDMVPLAVAIVVLLSLPCRASSILLGFAWFWPGAAVLLPIPLPLSAASVAGVAWLAWQQMRRTEKTESPTTHHSDGVAGPRPAGG